MPWEVLISLSVVLYSISVLLQRVLLKNDKSDPIAFSIFFQAGVALVISALVVMTRGGISMPSMGEVLWSLALMTVTYALANIFIFKSLKVTEASRFTVIFTSKTLFAIGASTLVFREGLTAPQWLGAVLIIVGVSIVSLQKIGQKLNKGDLYALIAAVLFGLANTNDRFLVKFFDPYSYVIIGFLLPAILVAAVYPKKIAAMKVFFQRYFLFKMSVLCLLYGLAAVAFFAALQIAPNSSQVFTINTFAAIITVLLSIVILKEKDSFARKAIGAVVSVLGLLLVNK